MRIGPLDTTSDQADIARRALLALGAVAPFALQVADAATPDRTLPPDLVEAVNAYDRATQSNDVAALADLVVDDYLLVNSDSSLQDKQSYLADFNVPGFRVDPYVMREPIAKTWGDAALTGGVLPLAWTQDGFHQSRLLRVAHMWSRREGRWRLVYTQLTRVPER